MKIIADNGREYELSEETIKCIQKDMQSKSGELVPFINDSNSPSFTHILEGELRSCIQIGKELAPKEFRGKCLLLIYTSKYDYEIIDNPNHKDSRLLICRRK